MTNLPAIPEPSDLTTREQFAVYGRELAAWVEQSDDLDAIREEAAKWAGIVAYMRKKKQENRDGLADAVAVNRRIEARIGHLIGGPTPPEDRRKKPQVSDMSFHNDISGGLTANERSAFRKMAAHPDVVEAVIAESTDDDPPTRAKVLAAIDGQNPDRATAGTGDPFSIRLPLDVDAVWRERAEEHGQTVAQFVTDYLVKAAKAFREKHAGFVAPPPKAAPKATALPADRPVQSFFKAQKAPKS